MEQSLFEIAINVIQTEANTLSTQSRTGSDRFSNQLNNNLLKNEYIYSKHNDFKFANLNS